MKKLIIVGMFMAASALPGFGQAKTQPSAEDEIQRLNSREVEGLLKNDVKTLQELWSDDFVVTNPLNQFVNKQNVLDLVTSGTLAFSAYDRRVEYKRLYGEIAIVAGSETVVWAGKMPLAGKTSHLRFTAVWRKQHGTWREIARHANVIPPQPPAQPSPSPGGAQPDAHKS